MPPKRSKQPHKPKPIQGLILHCGHVESQRVGLVVLRHLSGGFNTINDALSDLANYLLESCIYDPYNLYKDDDLPLSYFQEYIDNLPNMMASGWNNETTWDRAHTNEEHYWAWDTISQLYQQLKYFYENTGEMSLSAILPCYLNPKKIKIDSLAEEVKLHKEYIGDNYKSSLSAAFTPVVPVISKPKKSKK